MNLKDDIIDMAPYPLIIIGLGIIIISYQIGAIYGFLIGVIGIVAFLLGLKLQILYCIKKNRVDTWREEDLDKLLLVLAENLEINQSLRRNGFGPKIDDVIKKLLNKKG